jgi:hypothetical protein
LLLKITDYTEYSVSDFRKTPEQTSDIYKDFKVKKNHLNKRCPEIRILQTFLITTFICITSAITYAQTVPAATDSEIADRINFITHELNNEKTYATAWTGGWTIFNAGSAAYFYYAAANTHNKANQVTNMVIGVGSTLATIGNIVTPLVSMYAPHFLEQMPDGTHVQKLAKLKKAEDYLEDGADLETFGTSWIAQSINIATASAGAFVVGSLYRKTMVRAGKNPTKEAIIIFCECFASGELQILSQPMQLVSSQKKYKQQYGSSGSDKDNQVTLFAYPVLEEKYGLAAGISTTF